WSHWPNYVAYANRATAGGRGATSVLCTRANSAHRGDTRTTTDSMAGKRKPPPCSSTAESGSPIVPQECDTGIQGVGKIAWGSHFCNFYDNQIDLADCLVPFFKAGLDNN